MSVHEDVEMCIRDSAKAVVANDRDQIKKAIKKIQELYCQKSYGEIQREIQQLRPLVEALLTMTKAYLTAWQQKKQQKKLLEFSDLEHLCLQLLQAEGNGVAAEMRQQFVEVLVEMCIRDRNIGKRQGKLYYCYSSIV